MIIGGLQPVTLLDYPQKLAAIIFTVGCNMRCSFCYNSSLVLSEKIEKLTILDNKKVVDFLRKRKKYLDGIVITGGEPTLQSDLIGFCKKMKKIGYSIKLDTNGLLPEKLAELLSEKLIDYVAMDIKGPLDKYSKIIGVDVNTDNIKRSVELLLNSKLPHEFRTTLVYGLHSRDDVKSMAKLISGADKYYLQNFKSQSDLVGQEFSGKKFSSKLMAEFRKIANRRVKECEIR